MKKIIGLLFSVLAAAPAFGQPVQGQLPSGTLWGNSTAARAPASPITPSAIIDRAISGTQGAVFTRNASGWIGLAPGTAGLPLLSGGAGANLAYGIPALAAGGTGANLTASNGGIFYSTATTAGILAGTTTARQMLQSGASTTPAWSTTTWPATTTINRILFSSSANVIGEISTVNGGLLNANSSGVPALTVTPVLGVPGASQGTFGFAGLTSGTATITAQATAGTPTLTLPNASGTFAVSATSPVVLSATTGALTCPTCVTSSGGGAITGTAPISVSGAGAVSLDDAGVTYAKIQNIGALAVMGRSANSSGVGANISAVAASDSVLRESGSTIGFGTIATGGIANSAVTNAKLAAAAAYTLKGNFTGSAAAPTDTTIGSLTQKATPAGTDLVLIQDQAASGAFKYATVASIGTSSGVSSIAGNTGAFTLTQPITNSTNAILLNATVSPQGRLTLTTGTPVLTSTVSAATTVYYTPYIGNLVPIYDGTNVIPTAISELSVALGSNWAANSNYDLFVGSDAGTIRLCSGPAWTSDTGRGTGAATTEISRTLGLWMNANSMTCRYNNTTTFTCAANRCTYVGTFRTTGSTGQTEYVLGGSGVAGSLLVWNNYNRVNVAVKVTEPADSWTYAVATVRPLNNSTTNRVSFLHGLSEDPYSGRAEAPVLSTGGNSAASIGVGFNSTSTFCGTIIWGGFGAVNGFNNSFGQCSGYALGFNYLQAEEYSFNTNAITIFGDNGGPTFLQAGLTVSLRM